MVHDKIFTLRFTRTSHDSGFDSLALVEDGQKAVYFDPQESYCGLIGTTYNIGLNELGIAVDHPYRIHLNLICEMLAAHERPAPTYLDILYGYLSSDNSNTYTVVPELWLRGDEPDAKGNYWVLRMPGITAVEVGNGMSAPKIDLSLIPDAVKLTAKVTQEKEHSYLGISYELGETPESGVGFISSSVSDVKVIVQVTSADGTVLSKETIPLVKLLTYENRPPSYDLKIDYRGNPVIVNVEGDEMPFVGKISLAKTLFENTVIP